MLYCLWVFSAICCAAIQRSPSADCEAASHSAALAKTAATAAVAAAQAQRILKGANEKSAALQPAPAPRTRDEQFTKGSALQHDAGYERASCDARSIPSPTLLARQACQPTPSERGHHYQQIARPMVSRATKRGGDAGGTSTSPSPAPVNKDGLFRRWQCNGTMASAHRGHTTAPKAACPQQGRAGRSLQPAAAPISRATKPPAQQKCNEPVPEKTVALRQPATALGQQRGAGGPQGLRSATAPDVDRPSEKRNGTDRNSIALAGAVAAKELLESGAARSATPLPKDAVGGSTANGAAQASHTSCSEESFTKGEEGEERPENATAPWRAAPGGESTEADLPHEPTSPASTMQTESASATRTAEDPVVRNDVHSIASNDTSTSSSGSRSDGNILDVAANGTI